MYIYLLHVAQVSYCGIWIAKPHWRPASRIAHLVKIPLAASPMKLYYFRHSRQHNSIDKKHKGFTSAPLLH